MDGVIFDSYNFAKDNFTSVYSGVTDEMYRNIFKGNFYDEVKKYSNIRKVETEEEKKYRQKKYTEIKSKAPMFKGIKELLESLQKPDIKVVLGTGAHDRNCLDMLKYAGITHLFDYIATAEVSKSKIEKFKLIQNKYSVDKEDIVFITDTLGDVKEADIAGITTIAVTWGFHNRSYFEKENHPNLISIIDTIEELGEFINNYRQKAK